MSNTMNDALLIIKEVRGALQNGVKHYDIHGKLLTTDKEIIEALCRDGEITFDPQHTTNVG